MGFFGAVKNFFFETEAMLLIKCELETQREANKKLFEWNEKLQSHNEQMRANMDKVLVKLDEQNKFNKSLTDGVINITSNIVNDHIKPLAIAVSEHGALNSNLTKHHDAIKERLAVIYNHTTKHANKTNELVDSIVDAKITPLSNTVESVRIGVGNTTDKLAALQSVMLGHFENLRSDADLLLKTISNVEQVVTEPKPLADLRELVDKTLQSVEHINGFLNSEEYKQQWDMKQVEVHLVEVRQLLETVDALFPKPSGGTQEKIQELVESTDKLYLKPKDIMDALGFSKRQVYSALSRMCKNGSLLLLNRGEYTTQSKLDKYNDDQKKVIEESDKVLAENSDTDGNIGIG